MTVTYFDQRGGNMLRESYTIYIETIQENCGMNDKENSKAIETISKVK